MKPGALLAIPLADAPSVNASLTTLPARRLLYTLSHFGAYIVDDTYWNSTGIAAERGVKEEFRGAYGYDMNVTASATEVQGSWYRDYLTLMRALYVVVNNGPASVGGGGEPLAPSPPPFC